MKEIEKIQQAVCDALTGAGLTALTAYPDRWAGDYGGAVATVDVGTAESGPMGFCSYLGEVYDPEAGTVLELYGKQLDAEIWVDVRGGTAQQCREGCTLAAEVLLGGLPGGIRPGELSWEGLEWESATQMFRRRGRLRCRAVFQAAAHEDAEEFLDFQLKGAVQT